MVRREDPVWGGEDEALEANFDTFHYTNAAPQHGDLNQRMSAWLGLEDFIFENCRTRGLKVSVFTRAGSCVRTTVGPRLSEPWRHPVRVLEDCGRDRLPNE